MITLGEFLGLIGNFYDDAALVKVFDSAKVVGDSDGLHEDFVGFAFAVSVGESCDFLDECYKNAVIKSIYVEENCVVKVLIEVNGSSESTDNINV